VRNKIIFGLTIIVTMLFIIMIYKPEQAYATQSGTDEVVAEGDITVGDGYSVHIYSIAQVSYSYDEGVTGWITEVNTSSGAGSNDIRIDEFHAVDCSDYGSATYCEVYYLYCFTFWEDYVGYVEIYYSCDEWGNLSSWIKYNPINSN